MTLKEKAQSVVTDLLSAGVFEHGLYKETYDTFQGLSDSYKRMFYVTRDNVDEEEYSLPDSYSPKNGIYSVTSSMKIVGMFADLDAEKVIKTFIAAISRINGVVVSATDNERVIYEDESGDTLKKDMRMARVRFEISHTVTVRDCIQQSLCKTDAEC